MTAGWGVGIGRRGFFMRYIWGGSASKNARHNPGDPTQTEKQLRIPRAILGFFFYMGCEKSIFL